jgi:hypothetical protein
MSTSMASDPGIRRVTLVNKALSSNSPTGPFVIFIARSSKCHNGSTVHGQKIWLRGSMSHVERAFRSKYGELGNRPRAYCAFVHESNTPLPPTSDEIQYVTSVIQRAREAGAEAILVISGWDGFTTHEPNFINVFKDFKEVKITVLIYASFMADSPRQFWEVDPHKISDHFEGKMKLEDDSETDHSALFVERFQFIHRKRASLEEALQVLMEMTGRSREELKEECNLEAIEEEGEREYGEENEGSDEEQEKKAWQPRKKRGRRI